MIEHVHNNRVDWRVQMYAKFCGLGIHNCLLHARVVRLRAENKNVTELVAYRTIATTEQALRLMVRLL